MNNDVPAQTRPEGVPRRTKVLVSVLSVCGIAVLIFNYWMTWPDYVKLRPLATSVLSGSGTAHRAEGLPVHGSTPPPAPQPSRSYVQVWKVVLPASAGNYTRQADDKAAASAVEQLRAAGAKDAVGAVYVSDLDPRDVVVISGGTGAAFGQHPEWEVDAAMMGFMSNDVVRLSVSALDGRGACAGSVTCVLIAEGVRLDFTFSGPGTDRSADAALQVAPLSLDLVKPL